MDKKELNEIIKEDKKIYFGKKNVKSIIKYFSGFRYMRIGKLVILARKSGWYQLHMNENFIYKVLCYIYKLRKNRLGEKLNIELDVKEFGRRLKIYHGNVVINGYSKIGDDCQLHGNNCIGNKGEKYDVDKCPVIGNNVDVGVGSNIIGDVVIPNNTIISANSLVNKSIDEESWIIGGVPAKKIKKMKDRGVM